jgi:PAS domain S-box-containing protein
MTASAAPPSFLENGGLMGARMRSHDWAGSPLGSPEAWPRGLQAAVQIMLTSRFAMWMAWGPQLTFFCNDAYLPTLGLKGDWVLGARSDRVWAEIWPDIGPRIHHVLQTGEATWDEALPLYLERSGFSEETYHTFSYSPLDDGGVTAGMLCVVAEVTERVIGERQLAALRDLGSRLAAAATRSEAMQALETALAAEERDMPFALVYLIDNPDGRAELAARHGVPRGSAAAPDVIEPGRPGAPWPLATPRHGGPAVVPVPPNFLGGFPLAHWQKMPGQALVTPIAGAEGETPAGFLVAGLNPHRALTADYRGFIELVAGQLAAAIARADEYERERARAEALAEIDRAKTAFFSNVSHEFRTPLTLMLGPLEDALAERDTLPPAQSLRVEVAHRNGLRLLRLVNGLLDFSRIEAGRVEAVFRPTDLAAMTEDLASTFRSACERAGLTLRVECAPLPEPVYIDADMWEKVILNLLSNAFKFTLDGGIRVSLQAAGDSVELAVSDTGTGIPAAELSRLFERFHRVEGAKGRSFEGSGIGLALVQDLVRLHGGEVTVQSREGEGSTFRVRLPFGHAHLPAARVHDEADGAGSGRRAQAYVDEALGWLPDEPQLPHALPAEVIDDAGRGSPAGVVGRAARGGHVLLADDNADLRHYVGRLLESRGYEVQAVGDGAAALAAVRARRPDLLLTDVMMPGMDGFALLQAVRADPALSDLPVVMLSARAGEEAQVEGLSAGADDYLVKPFSARELLARVAANLDMARTRREAAEAVRESEARLRGVLEGMAEGFMLLDAGFRFVEINAELLRLDGRPRAAFIGRTHAELYPDFESAEAGALFRKAMDGRVPVTLEHLVTWPSGRQCWMDMRAYPTEHGGLAVFYRDVSGRRAAEQALLDLNATLERRVVAAVAEREQALARLHEAQKLETLGQLTGGVAHDFNNLLTPVMSALHLLGKWHGDPRSQKMVTLALESVERARTLVQRLLAFARRQALAPLPTDLAALVTGMRELIARSLGPSISIRMEVAFDLPPVLVDPNQLELALLNLAVNARDAMEGGGVLTLAAAEATGSVPATLPPGRYVSLQVRDTGCGMDEDTMARAVEPFFTTKEVGKGTGLGLSMVHGLALQSGGAFHLASTPHVGTAATLWLPVAAGAAASAAGADPHAEAPAAPRRATLLLVDDEPLVAATTAELLQELDYEVIPAGSATEALGLVRGGIRPDLVVTDYMMPGMTGAQLAAELRRNYPGLPVLVVTGFASAHAAELRNLEALSKPFTFSELAERVAGLVGAGAGK